MSVRLFKSLLFKSAQIQHLIEQERFRRLPDTLRLLKLKRIRLKIKDRLQHLLEMPKEAIQRTQMKPQLIRIKNR